MEQDFADGDSQQEITSGSVSQGLKDAMLQFFGGSFALRPRPPSGSLDETKKKTRPSPVLPRLLRKAPAGLSANLKGIRSAGTDDEDSDAADLGSYVTSPTVVKRVPSFLQSAPTLTPEHQSLIMRTKTKPPRASTDSDLLVPPSPPRTPFNPSSGAGVTPSGPGSLATRYQDLPTAGGSVMHSTFSVVRRASSCRFSDSQPFTIVDPLQQPQSQPEASMAQVQQPQQLQPQPPQQRPCPPRLARQAQPLVPSSALMSASEFDRGYASLDGRPSRSSTPTGRSLRQGLAPIPPGLSVTAAAAAATAAAAGPTSPFSVAGALAAATGAAAGSGAATAPVVMSNFQSSYSATVSGGGGGGSGARSGLSSPLSAPPLPGSAKPAFVRTAVVGVPQPSLPGSSAHAASPFAAAVATAAAAGEPGGSVGRSSSRRFLAQSTMGQAGGKAATAAAGGVAGSVAQQVMERSGGGPNVPLPRISSPRGSGNSFTGGQPRGGAISVWQLAAAAGGGKVANCGDDGDDGELTVLRRSCSAVAGVSPLAAFGMGTGDISDGAASGGISGTASAQVILTDLSDAESADEGEVAAAAAAAAAAVAAGDVSVRRGRAIGGLLNAFAEEGPLSSAARQLVALHRAQEKSKARKGRSRGPQDAEGGSSRWRPSFTNRMG